ncbi:hypothetical protein TTHERM_00158130 (macronuclear) [Tetrahymena thermophila SB210]|uniref:Uncharacterized protein n=1 Tax=Tetrahymena thermophila (strain SB210) TaxID=312017 RepID=Q22WC1_TETTS|nr:hypothetical protein TTHERM_00158130 [Tetrahymena thermophila SB210]EAR89496.1 hypothetical protein TTHERM_00158130 [Tetrahymena thermophila SB210]|eukprot:XP_001009741.1 hypothetical protein TTHERM_00158130 [Tetrahymena thermophila SB210]
MKKMANQSEKSNDLEEDYKNLMESFEIYISLLSFTQNLINSSDLLREDRNCDFIEQKYTKILHPPLKFQKQSIAYCMLKQINLNILKVIMK